MKVPVIYSQILTSDSHVLIAGATGAGKSVLLNGLLRASLCKGAAWMLIDLKKVELWQWSHAKRCWGYADTISGAATVITKAKREMDARYREMRLKGQRRSTRSPLYVVFDEYADFALNAPKKAKTDLSVLATQGRAAGVFLILCTQRPTRDIITPLIKVNCGVIVGLRCDTPQDSRNVINNTALCDLPAHGEMIVKLPTERDLYRYNVPYYSDAELSSVARLA